MKIFADLNLNCESTAFSEYCGTLMTKLEKTTCSEQSKAGTRISARSLTFFQPLKEEKQKRILFFYIYSLHLLPSGTLNIFDQ